MSLPVYSDVQLAGSLKVSGSLQSQAPITIRSKTDEQKELIRIHEFKINPNDKDQSLEIYIPSTEQTTQIKQHSAHIKIEPQTAFNEYKFYAESFIEQYDVDTKLTKIVFSKLGYTFTIKWEESRESQAWNLFLYTDCDVKWGADIEIYRGYDGSWQDDPRSYRTYHIPHQKIKAVCLVDDDRYYSDEWDQINRLLCAKITLSIQSTSISIPDIPVDINIASKIKTLTFDSSTENFGIPAAYGIEYKQISNAEAGKEIWVSFDSQPTKILSAYDGYYEPTFAGDIIEISDKMVLFRPTVSGIIHLICEVIVSGSIYKLTQDAIEHWSEEGLKRKQWSKLFNMIPD